jgi:hypothetical protein
MRPNLSILFVLLIANLSFSQSFTSYLNKGDSCAELRELNQAISFYNKAMAKKPERLLNTNNEAIIFYQLAYVYSELSDHQTALEYLFKFVEKDCVKKSDSLLCNAYNRIGSNYDFLSKPQQALKFYHKSLEHAGSSSAMMGRAYNNIADSYQELGKIDEAKNYFLKGLEYFKKGDVYDGKLVVYINLGTVEVIKKRMESAQRYFENALDIAVEMKDTFYIVIAKVYLAEFYTTVTDYKKAEDLLNWSLSKALDYNMPKYVNESYKRYVDLYEKKKDYKKAFEFMKLYKANSDSLFNINSDREYAELEAKYSIREKEKENELLKTKQSLTESQVNSQRNYIHMLVAIVIGGLILILLLFYQRIKRAKAKKQLEVQNREISKAKKQLEDLNFQYEKLISKYENKDN